MGKMGIREMKNEEWRMKNPSMFISFSFFTFNYYLYSVVLSVFEEQYVSKVWYLYHYPLFVIVYDASMDQL